MLCSGGVLVDYDYDFRVILNFVTSSFTYFHTHCLDKTFIGHNGNDAGRLLVGAHHHDHRWVWRGENTITDLLLNT